ncbi:MAG: tetratricopeptide repeat protein [Bacteroidota bacterium]
MHDLVLQHQFKQARLLLNDADPADEDVIYLHSLSDFIQIHITEDQEKLPEFKAKIKNRIDVLEDQPSARARFVTAVLHIELTVTKARFEEYFSAAMEFRRAYGIIRDLTDDFPDYQPGRMLQGLSLILFGSIPEQYNWAIRALNIKGDVHEGLQILDDVFLYFRDHPSDYLMAESLLFLTFSHRSFNNTPEALNMAYQYYQLPKVQSLTRRSPFMRYSYAALLIDMGDNDKAIGCLNQPYPVQPEIPYYYVDYYLRGMCLLHKLDYKSEDYFQAYINSYPGKSYKKASVQKLAWIELLSNGQSSYTKMLKQVNQYQNSIFSADQSAQKEFEQQEVPNKVLLKVRILFDGGYYDEALKVLVSHKPSENYTSTKDGLEFTYRLGRIHDKRSNSKKAKAFYTLTIKNGRSLPYYYAANAALHLGKIHLHEKNFDQAKKAFRDCLSMRPDTYRSSIHQKAKAYLQKLE